MNIVTMPIDIEMSENLERLHYESESYKAIISYILSNDMDISNDTFKHYQEEFTEINKKYNQAKDDLTINYVKKDYPDAIVWNMDFVNHIVNITLP